MKTKEELNALKEEELEQAVGGEKLPDPKYDPENKTKCPHYFFDPIHWTEKCNLPKESRTLNECNVCPYNIFLN